MQERIMMIYKEVMYVEYVYDLSAVLDCSLASDGKRFLSLKSFYCIPHTGNHISRDSMFLCDIFRNILGIGGNDEMQKMRNRNP